MNHPNYKKQRRGLGKPLLIGETGVFKKLLGAGTSERNGIFYPFDYHQGIDVFARPLCKPEKIGVRRRIVLGIMASAPIRKRTISYLLSIFPEFDDAMFSVWHPASTRDAVSDRLHIINL